MTAVDYLRFLLTLVFVLGLFGLVVLLMRRFLPGQATATRNRGKQRRLAIVEAIALDSRRRLVLVRRDQVEHLVILGPNGDTVVETGVVSPATPAFADLIEANQPQPESAT